MRILTSEAMAKVDRTAIDELGIPSMVLMENAAAGAVDALGKHFPEAGRVALLCGPGNNGGDGLAMARRLAARGYRVEIFLAAGGRDLKGDALLQQEICERMGLVPRPVTEESLDEVLGALRRADVVVDALFGTGLDRPLEGLYARLVEGVNEGVKDGGAVGTAGVLAVDVPSGLSGSRAEPLGPHVRADLTVTFAALKLPHVFLPAAEAVGEVEVAELGIPPALVEGAEGDLYLAGPDDARRGFPLRDEETHKGTYGHVLVVAGSAGKAGAALLAARAAVRSGAGLVTVAVPEPIRDIVDLGSLESMTLGLPAGPEGEITAEAADVVLAALKGKDALGLGPGLGTTEGAAEAIRRIVRECPVPSVLDADALNAFARSGGGFTALTSGEAPRVLTPHPGEMGRLLGSSAAEVQKDRLGAARRAARESGAVVVLKGNLSLIAEPDGPLFVNPTGCPGMATGGSGDVLTGMIAALLARGHDAREAAVAACYVHGLAGERAAEQGTETSMAAGDLLTALPDALRRLG